MAQGGRQSGRIPVVKASAAPDPSWPPPPVDRIEGLNAKDKASYQFTDAGDYRLGPMSRERPQTPRGQLSEHNLETCVAYPGVKHQYRLYKPPRHDPSEAIPLMIFLDGPLFLDPRVSTATVLDNLIQERAVPKMLALFVSPGDNGPGLPIWGGVDNRSIEYDVTTDLFACFLFDELVPVATRNIAIKAGGDNTAIAGISSSGAAAFTAAWNRPHLTSKVLSLIGSFVDIRGANCYPSLIRKTPAKSLRVFLQSGENDLDIVFGNWPVANQDMAAALAYRDYDHQFVFGVGGHSPKHGASILPDALRWLWRSEPG
jgi:enterochelin esterase family protein